MKGALPAPLAFTWVMWRQHGDGFLLGLGILFAGAIVSAVVPAHHPTGFAKEVFPAACLFLISALSIYTLFAFTYGGESADALARESCFPAYLLRLPVSTGSLILVPVLFGAATALALWLTFAWFILGPWLALSQDVAPLWPALLGMATLAWAQALCWSPFGLPWLRVILLTAVVFGLIVSAASLANSGVNEGWLATLFGILSAVAWIVSYNGVVRARRGDVPNWEGLLRPVQQLIRGLARRARPFASAARAQAWFEWRRSGNSLPVMTAMVLPVQLLFLGLGENDVLSTVEIVFGALGTPIFLAGVFGTRAGNTSPRKGHIGLGPHSASLPLATADMIGAMLKVAARSTLIAWAIVAAAVPLALGLTGNVDNVTAWLRRELPGASPVKTAVSILVVMVLLLVWTWKRHVDALHFGLSGRHWVANCYALLWIPGSVGVLVLSIWIFKNPSTHEVTLAVLPWILGALLPCRLVAAAWALRRALRQGLLAPRTVSRWITGWLLLASVMFGLLLWIVPAERVYYLAFAVLYIMPMARLAATPLALAWNRHR